MRRPVHTLCTHLHVSVEAGVCQLQEGTAADAGGLRDTLLYNGALQALLLGRPATALRCFRVRMRLLSSCSDD